MGDPPTRKYEVSWVTSFKNHLTPFFVIGDAEHVIEQMLLTSDSLKEIGLTRDRIKVEPVDWAISLDPGGMLKLENPRRFTIDGVEFSIRPHKLMWETQEIENAPERVEGYHRIPQGPGSAPYFIFVTPEMRQALLQVLMAMEFEPGVKEQRDKDQAIHDAAFEKGLLARPAPGGGYYVVDGYLDPSQLFQEEDGGEDFTVPEGIEPF